MGPTMFTENSPPICPRFLEVLKFHAPGLAPVRDAFGAYHVTPDGHPAYESRYHSDLWILRRSGCGPFPRWLVPHPPGR